MATRAERAAQRREYWRQHFEARRNSGLSVRAYAARHELREATYYAAQQRYADRSVTSASAIQQTAPESAARFARVAMAMPESGGRVLCRVRLANGAQLELECDGAGIEPMLRAVSAFT